jgi:hypothetical protein
LLAETRVAPKSNLGTAALYHEESRI